MADGGRRAKIGVVRSAPPADWAAHDHTLQIIDVCDVWNKERGEPVVHIFGTTLGGFSMCAEVRGFRPYFYASMPPGLCGDEGVGAVEALLRARVCERICETRGDRPVRSRMHSRYADSVEASLAKSNTARKRGASAKGDADDALAWLITCSRVDRASIVGCSLRADGVVAGPGGRPRRKVVLDKDEYVRIELYSHDVVREAHAVLREAHVFGNNDGARPARLALFEADIDVQTRILSDRGLVGCGWLAVPAAKCCDVRCNDGRALQKQGVPSPSGMPATRHTRPAFSRCQLEVALDIDDVHPLAAEGEMSGSAPLVEHSWDIECAGHNGFCVATPGPPLVCAAQLFRIGDEPSTQYVLRVPRSVAVPDRPAYTPLRVTQVLVNPERTDSGTLVRDASGNYACAAGFSCRVESNCAPQDMRKPVAVDVEEQCDADNVDADQSRAHKRARTSYGGFAGSDSDLGSADANRGVRTVLRKRLVQTRHVGSLMVSVPDDNRGVAKERPAVHEMRFFDAALRDVTVLFEAAATRQLPSRSVVCRSDLERPAGDDPIIQIGSVVRMGGRIALRHIVVLGTCTAVTFTERDGTQTPVIVENVRTETDLLARWQDVVRSVDPDLLYGYNTGGFDIEYVWERARLLGMLERDADVSFGWISRGMAPATARSKQFTSGATGTNDRMQIEVTGRCCVDIMWAIKRAGIKMRSFSLNVVAQRYLGDQKNEMDPSLMWQKQCSAPEDRAEMATYCVKDCDLVAALVTKLCIIPQNVEMGQGYKIISQIIRDSRVRGTYIVPTFDRDPGGGGKNSGDDKYEGAIVVEAKRGFYTNPIGVLDFEGLYPSIMRAHNQCYTTVFFTEAEWRAAGFADEDVEYAPVGALPCWYLRGVDADEDDERRGVLPVMLKRLFVARSAVKGIIKVRAKVLCALQHEMIADVLPAGKDAVEAAAALAAAAKGLEAGSKAAKKAADAHDKALKVIDKLVKNNEALLERHPRYSELEALEIELQVLDGRQLALKVSSNSIYGFTGATIGKLPCLQIAAAVTGWGREMIETTIRIIEARFTVKNGYAYDADVVYGDTDSVFIDFGPVSKERVIELCQEAATLVTAAFQRPIRIVFEKFYAPFLLMSAKRYAGLYHTRADIHDYVDSKGTERVRRDIMPIVARSVNTVLDKLLLERDVEGAMQYVRDTVARLQRGDVPIYEVTRSAQLSRPIDAYDNQGLAHLNVVRLRQQREPGSAPKVGDRVPYTYVRGNDKKTKRAEDPIYMVRHGIEPDEDEAIEQLRKPMQRILGPVMRMHSRQRSVADMFSAAAAAAAAVVEGDDQAQRPRKRRRLTEAETEAEKKADAALVDTLLVRQPIASRHGALRPAAAFAAAKFERVACCLACGSRLATPPGADASAAPAACARCHTACATTCTRALPESPVMPPAPRVPPPPARPAAPRDIFCAELARTPGELVPMHKRRAAAAFKALSAAERKPYEARAKEMRSGYAARLSAHEAAVEEARSAHAALMEQYGRDVAEYQQALAQVRASACTVCAGRVAELRAVADAAAAEWASKRAALHAVCIRCTRGSEAAARDCVNWDCNTRFEREQTAARVAETAARSRRFVVPAW